jgi:hypothetical protein
VAAATSAIVDAESGTPLMTTVGGNSFSPTGTYTREQAIMTLFRLHNAFPQWGQDGLAVAGADQAFPFPLRFSARDMYGDPVTEESLESKGLFFVYQWGTW